MAAMFSLRFITLVTVICVANAQYGGHPHWEPEPEGGSHHWEPEGGYRGDDHGEQEYYGETESTGWPDWSIETQSTADWGRETTPPTKFGWWNCFSSANPTHFYDCLSSGTYSTGTYPPYMTGTYSTGTYPPYMTDSYHTDDSWFPWIREWLGSNYWSMNDPHKDMDWDWEDSSTMGYPEPEGRRHDKDDDDDDDEDDDHWHMGWGAIAVWSGVVVGILTFAVVGTVALVVYCKNKKTIHTRSRVAAYQPPTNTTIVDMEKKGVMSPIYGDYGLTSPYASSPPPTYSTINVRQEAPPSVVMAAPVTNLKTV